MSTPHPLAGAHLYLDCFSGIAGDMFLGAMLNLGVPEDWLRAGLAGLPLTGYELVVGRKEHHSLVGCDVRVEVADRSHHAHRRYRDIQQMVRQAELPDVARDLALAIFEKVAQAEARVHGVAVSEVVFHEVGAVDSIVDIVGAALAVAYLQPARVTSRAVPLGSGFTRGAHGSVPIPSPAAVEILKGALVEQGTDGVELCTPTGAAILATLANGFGALPIGRVLAVGYGAGDCSLPDRPNHLRAILIAEDPPSGGAADEKVLIETNLDDISGEVTGYAVERLFAEGAHDVWVTPILMKKGRPATKLSMLCDVVDQQRLVALVLRETTAIGVRRIPVQRSLLTRRVVEVSTPFGVIEVKEAYDGPTLVNVAPEFESCRAIAAQVGVPIKRVYAAANMSYWKSRSAADSAGLTATCAEQEP